MSNYINENLLDSGYNKKLKDESKALVSKWDRTGLLEGLDGDYNKSSMAILLENQARQLVQEASKTTPDSNISSGQEEWSGVALPLVRRIFAEIAAQEFVSVQPMNLPSGLVFFLDFKYGTSYNRDGRATTESLYGKTGPNTPTGSSGTYPEGGLYGAGAFEYSAKLDSGSGGIATTSPSASAAVTLANLNYDSDFSASNAGALYIISGTWIQGGSDIDELAIRTLDFSGSTFDSNNGKIYKRFTSYNTSTSLWTAIASGSSAADLETAGDSELDALYMRQPQNDYTRGDFEQNTFTTPGPSTADDINIPEVNLDMKSLPIVAKTRKLKAIWTPELAQDLNAYHSVDAEAELTAMLSEYISMEIDLEILDMLIADAVTTDYWSARVGYEYSSADSNFVNNLNATNALAYTKREWWATLGSKLQKVSNKIHQLTLRGGANFIVCSPDIATIIESIPGFNTDTDGTSAQFSMGVQQVGSLKNRWSVYKNPYMIENTILVGFRGSNFLETGAVYAPYVPLIMTPLVYDPTDFTPRKGVMTRYAKKMIRPEFYGKIKVHGLETL